jgi:hypothetical protein
VTHSRPVDHNFQPVSAGLDRVIARSLRNAPEGTAPVLAWPLACGSAVAERTRALDFSNGILRVEVPDRGWQLELQALAPRYLAALNRYVAENVARIEFLAVPQRP